MLWGYSIKTVSGTPETPITIGISKGQQHLIAVSRNDQYEIMFGL